jgi:hypothetical protein
MMAQCIQEEERLKNQLGDSISFAQHQAKKKNKFSKQNFKKPGTPGVSSSRTPQRPETHGKMKISGRHHHLHVLQGKGALQEELPRIFEVPTKEW